MKTEVYTRAFAGGEITPEFFGRLDDIKFQTGLAVCRNFVVKPHGPVENRAGFRLVREVKNSAQRVRLLPFTYNDTQTMVLEVGVGYIRFHTQAATLMNGPVPYEITTPHSEDDLPKLRYTQSNDVLTLTVRTHPPAEVRRLGPLNWTYTPINFSPALPPPATVTATEVQQGPQPANPDPQLYEYVVTSISSTGSESVASGAADVMADLLATDNYIAVTWSAVTGAVRYRIYKRTAGLFGFIGETTELAFNDRLIAANTGRTPPIINDPFDASGNYPAACGYYDSRRWFASTDTKPQTVWATKANTESDMGYSLPYQDTDSIEFTIRARQAASVQHLVPLDDLILLATTGEWRVRGSNSDVITPLNPSAKARSFVGANDATPALVNSVVLFAAARGGHVYQLGYSEERGGYVPLDLCLRAPHLFDNFDIVDIAHARAPLPVVWMVSTSGKLLGLTYIPEEEVWAWHQHETAGFFESICVVTEGDYDALYAVIRRGTRRFVERMEPRLLDDPKEAFFVDCGLTYRGPPATVLTGLSHLNGHTVSILADGNVHPQRVVNGGSITLDYPASVVHVGLPYEAEARTLPVSVEAAGYGQGRPKNVNRAWLKLYQSSGVRIEDGSGEQVELKQRTDEPYGEPAALLTGEYELMPFGDWNADGQIAVLQTQPLPCTLLAVTKEVSFGGG